MTASSAAPRRVLVVPAAGRGSRLRASLPKALVPVAGRPMLGWLADLYRPWVSAVVVVAQPSARDALRGVLAEAGVRPVVAVQPEPTGMLDAVSLGCAAARPLSPDRVWVTWCDQVAVRAETIGRMARAEPETAIAFPVIARAEPYIHFDRDASGRIVGVRQRREGQAMPDRGESDMGLFSLSPTAAFDQLPDFARTAVADGATGERNFLPFIPWVARTAPVLTLPGTDPLEAVGINTPAELAQVEAYLSRRV